MKCGIGIDSVEIERFVHFSAYSKKQLRIFFSEQEIEYAFAHPSKTAQRLAVRFAAKEAFLKALSQLFPAIQFSLLTIAKYARVNKSFNGAPELLVNWDALQKSYHFESELRTQLSLTHTNTTASAVVLVCTHIT